jgi:hypothetical protein
VKIRNGFVSNSSSSSFILFLKKVPESIEETQKMLFDDEELYCSPYGDQSWPTRSVAEIVFKDIKAGILTKEDMADSASEWNSDGDPDYPSYPEYHKRVDTDSKSDKVIAEVFDTLTWFTFDKKKHLYGEKKAAEYLAKYPGHTVVKVTYADENGAQSGAMEHGDLFHRVPHIKVSQH